MRSTARSLALGASLVIWTHAGAKAATCTFTTIVGVSFGAYDPFDAAPVDSTGQLTIHCQGGATVIVELGKGRATTFSSRTLAGAVDLLGYNVCLDAARTVIWGDGTAGTGEFGPTAVPDGDLVIQSYGRIPAHQNVTAGPHVDSLTTTVDF